MLYSPTPPFTSIIAKAILVLLGENVRESVSTFDSEDEYDDVDHDDDDDNVCTDEQ
jgi:hypothetical protein